jgi:hypothetical protein
MNTSLRILAAAAVTIAVTLACVPQQTETVKLYEDPSRVPKTYTRLLVVDVSSDHAMQARFENEVVSGLKSAGVEAVPSHHNLDSSEGILQDDLNRLSDELGADAILITHIASLDTTIDREQGREEVLSTCRGGNPVDVFLYDRKVLKEPDSIKVAHTVVVITNLYDSATRDRVWSIQSTCFNRATMDEVLLAETVAIVRQLRVDKLI